MSVIFESEYTKQENAFKLLDYSQGWLIWEMTVFPYHLLW